MNEKNFLGMVEELNDLRFILSRALVTFRLAEDVIEDAKARKALGGDVVILPVVYEDDLHQGCFERDLEALWKEHFPFTPLPNWEATDEEITEATEGAIDALSDEVTGISNLVAVLSK